MAFDVSLDANGIGTGAGYEPPPAETAPRVTNQEIAGGGGANARAYEARYDANAQRYALESRLPPAQPARAAAQDDPALDAEKRELLLDITQIGLSVVGIFEPTPFADGADGIISLARGDLLGAGISVAGMLPYVGDLAKLGKLPKFVKILDRAVTIAKADARFAESLRPGMEALKRALDAVPVDSLPAAAREQIQALRTKVDEFFAAQRRNIDGHEAARGHTLKEHVGRSESWLRNRLAREPNLEFASSFRNEAIANRVQGRFVNRYGAEINEWLKSGEETFKARIDMGEPVGIVVERGRSGHSEASRAFVMLVRDDTPRGWHILTSYPIK